MTMQVRIEFGFSFQQRGLKTACYNASNFSTFCGKQILMVGLHPVPVVNYLKKI